MAFQVASGDTLAIRGTLDASSGTLTLKDDQVARAKLAREDESQVGIDLANFRVWDNMTAFLPQASATDDLGLIEGTWGTDAVTLQTADQKANGTPTATYGRKRVKLTNEYILGETLKLRVRGGMITTVSDTTATVDLEVYVSDGDGAQGSDLCATAATSINSLTKANVDFTITAGSLAYGDILDIRLAITIEDGATATAVIGEVSDFKMLRDIRG